MMLTIKYVTCVILYYTSDSWMKVTWHLRLSLFYFWMKHKIMCWIRLTNISNASTICTLKASKYLKFNLNHLHRHTYEIDSNAIEFIRLKLKNESVFTLRNIYCFTPELITIVMLCHTTQTTRECTDKWIAFVCIIN